MIRPAVAADVPALVAAEREVFGDESWSQDVLAAHVAAGEVLVTDALDGWAVLTVAGDVADLQRIAVLPGVRRTGLGRALLDAALGHGRDAERVLLEVRADNEPALAMYAAAGFGPVDRRRRYYRDGADALVLSLEPQGR